VLDDWSLLMPGAFSWGRAKANLSPSRPLFFYLSLRFFPPPEPTKIVDKG